MDGNKINETETQKNTAIEDTVVINEKSTDTEKVVLKEAIPPQIVFPQETPKKIWKIVVLIVAIALTVIVVAVASFFAWNSVFNNEETNNLFEEGLVPAKSGDKWGYVNNKGTFIINPQFDYAEDFYEGLAVVEVGDKYGYINNSGEYVINLQFDNANSFNEGLAVVESDDKYGFINNNGTFVVSPQFDYAYPFNGGSAAVEVGERWGYIDKTGKYIINPQYPDVTSFYDDGYAVVLKTDKTYAIIDKNGEELFDTVVDGISWLPDICQANGCYESAYYDDETHCFEHRDQSSYLPFCDAFGCLNRVDSYLDDYCEEHGYMEY